MKHSVKLACLLLVALGACADGSVGESDELEGALGQQPPTTEQPPSDPLQGAAGSGALAPVPAPTTPAPTTPAPTTPAPGASDAGVPSGSADAGMSSTPDASMSSNGDASSAPEPPDASATPPLFPPPSTPAERIPSPDNPAECPDVAPADPWGPCAGLPVYVQCNYGTYACICDWIHWICVG